MIKILFEMWPAFIPLYAYLLWLVIEKLRGKDTKTDEYTVKKRKYLYRSFILSIILAIIGLLYFGLTLPQTEHIEMNNDRVSNG